MLLQLQPPVHRRYPENARTLALHEMRLLRERTQAQTPRFWNDDTAPGPGHMDIRLIPRQRRLLWRAALHPSTATALQTQPSQVRNCFRADLSLAGEYVALLVDVNLRTRDACQSAESACHMESRSV